LAAVRIHIIIKGQYFGYILLVSSSLPLFHPCFQDVSRGHRKLVPRYFQWERGGLDAHRMMTGDDTGGDVWTVAGAWEGLACSRGAA
jgi:hypothetical protein